MWFVGFVALLTFEANVGVLVWQPPQSPLVGWLLSKAVGRESPAVVAELATMPW
jgi:hypothetical protein